MKVIQNFKEFIYMVNEYALKAFAKHILKAMV